MSAELTRVEELQQTTSRRGSVYSPTSAPVTPTRLVVKEGQIEIGDRRPQARPVIDTATLYPAEGDSRLSEMIGLLSRGIEHVSQALQERPEERPLDADYELGKFRSMLPQLFEYRDIGDGFASVILAIGVALTPPKDVPTTPQLRAVIDALQGVRLRPRIHMANAAEILETLEAAGLSTTPPIVEELGDLLDPEE